MPAPKQFTDDAIRQALHQCNGSPGEAAKLLGCGRTITQLAKKRFRNEYNARQEPDAPPIARSDQETTTYEDILRRAGDYAEQRENNSPSKPMGVVNLQDLNEPIGVFLISDLHLGSPQCDYLTFLNHVRFLKTIPNLYAIIQGDVLEWSISQRMLDSTLGQVLTPQEQARVFRSAIDDLVDKLLAAIIGNHELRVERMAGFDIGEYLYQTLISKKVGVYMKDGGTLHIRLGTQQYSWRITHGDSRFGSMYTPTHKPAQLSRMSFGWHDIQSTGHTHDGSIQTLNVPRPDGLGLKDVAMLQASSYKVLGAEQYPDRLGFGRLATVQMPGVILYPQERRILPFLTVENMVQVLRAIQAGQASPNPGSSR